MPADHAEILLACRSTLAVIDKDGLEKSGLTQEQYWRDVIHRHAHRFAEQTQGTVYKYRCSDRRTLIQLDSAKGTVSSVPTLALPSSHAA
jgi:hypothetical protein